jgi:hypothetical protein
VSIFALTCCVVAFSPTEFWMTGDNNGRWGGEHSYPDDHALYIRNARDVIRRVRNHPSLLLWCGGNELSPPAQSPPHDIASALVQAVQELDGTRFYIQSSMNSFGTAQALAPADGPYGIQNLNEWWAQDPGLTLARVPFNPETGSVSTSPQLSRSLFSHSSLLYGLSVQVCQWPIRCVCSCLPMHWRIFRCRMPARRMFTPSGFFIRFVLSGGRRQ